MNNRLCATIVAAALVALLWSPRLVDAADHRDAPTIDEYSAIDINDVFMFRDPPTTGSNLVVALSTQAVADPQFGSSYHFQANALYRLNFSTKASAKPTANIDFVFGPFGNGPDCPAPAAACQTFTATFNFAHKVTVEGFATQGTARTMHLAPAITTSGNIKIFAGPREDPFFFDLVGFNRSIASGTNQFPSSAVDAFKGKNVNAIVVEFPISEVFPSGTCVNNISAAGFTTPCGAWAVTYLGDFDPNDLKHDDDGAPPKGLQQVDRMGNPAVNTALIPAALKDAFNFADPQNDAKDFASVILNQILTLDKAFGTCPSTATSAAACNPNVPLLASVAVPDTLKFAVNQHDGFPNGRQLQDRTTDLLISLILQLPGFTDGTAAKTYCSVFPFLGPPLQPEGGIQSCP